MDLLPTDIIVNCILPFLHQHTFIALQCTSKRYHRLVVTYFPYESRKHLEILGEICKGGFVNLLRWFLGCGKPNLNWSLLVDGTRELINYVVNGKNVFIFSCFLVLIILYCSWLHRSRGAAGERAAAGRGDGRWAGPAGPYTAAWQDRRAAAREAVQFLPDLPTVGRCGSKRSHVSASVAARKCPSSRGF